MYSPEMSVYIICMDVDIDVNQFYLRRDMYDLYFMHLLIHN